jgi:hypothetical protein
VMSRANPICTGLPLPMNYVSKLTYDRDKQYSLLMSDEEFGSSYTPKHKERSSIFFNWLSSIGRAQYMQSDPNAALMAEG